MDDTDSSTFARTRERATQQVAQTTENRRSTCLREVILSGFSLKCELAKEAKMARGSFVTTVESTTPPASKPPSPSPSTRRFVSYLLNFASQAHQLSFPLLKRRLLLGHYWSKPPRSIQRQELRRQRNLPDSHISFSYSLKFLSNFLHWLLRSVIAAPSDT